MTTPDDRPDADLHVRENFDRMMRGYLLSVLDDALIEEHRSKPEGHHSEPLTRLLAWAHSRPLHEQYAVHQCGDGQFRVVRLSGRRGVPPTAVGTQTHPTVRAARHAAFLEHVKDLTGR